MKRREFLKGLAAAAIVPAVVLKWLAAVVHQKVVIAPGLKKYPGRVVGLGDVSRQGKWSG